MAITGPIPLPQTGMQALLGSAGTTQNILNNLMANRRANQLMPAQLQQYQDVHQKASLANEEAQRQNLLERFKYNQQLKALAAKGYDVSGMGGSPSGQQPIEQQAPQSEGTQYQALSPQENAQGTMSVAPSYGKLQQMLASRGQQRPPMQSNAVGQNDQASSPDEFQITAGDPFKKVEGILTPVKTDIKGNYIEHTYGDGRTTLTPLPAAASSSEIGKAISDLEAIKTKYGENSTQYKLAQRAFNAKIGQQESLASLRQNPLRYAPAQVKNLNALQNQLKTEFPNYTDEQLGQLTDALISGKNEINGQPIPDVSSTAKTLLNAVYKTSSTAQMQNNAANLNNTANELEQFDLAPLKEFTGIGGTAKFLSQKLDPSTRTKAWYDYDAFKNSAQIYAMDTMRKGFGTSVVPDYVYATLGKMSNPVDPIWGDPEQVQTRWNKTLELIKRAAKNATDQARHGATTMLEGDKSSEKNASEQKYYSKSGREIKNVNGKWEYVNEKK